MKKIDKTITKLKILWKFRSIALFNPVTHPLDKRLIALAKDRMTTLNDYMPLVMPLFEVNPKDCIQSEEDRDIVGTIYVNLEGHWNPWKPEEIFKALKETMIEHNVKMGRLNRVIMGKEKGLPLNECMYLMGWFGCQRRFNLLLE